MFTKIKEFIIDFTTMYRCADAGGFFKFLKLWYHSTSSIGEEDNVAVQVALHTMNVEYDGYASLTNKLFYGIDFKMPKLRDCINYIDPDTDFLFKDSDYKLIYRIVKKSTTRSELILYMNVAKARLKNKFGCVEKYAFTITLANIGKQHASVVIKEIDTSSVINMYSVISTYINLLMSSFAETEILTNKLITNH